MKKGVSYKNIFPTETIFEWHNIKAFHKHFQIDLGSVIIKTSTLRKIKKRIEENIFYMS